MPVESSNFRPSHAILDLFWALSDGNDEQRNSGVLKLENAVKALETGEKQETLKYCRERLVRGLSSGRKFARAGFAVALVQLLRSCSEFDTGDVLLTMKEKLKITGSEKKSKAEIGGTYLGRAFAISAIIQSGRVSQLSSDVLASLVTQLSVIGEKRSYLRSVCMKILEDLVHQVSMKAFAEQIWPQVKSQMKQGWHLCTIDQLSLFLTCRNKFPDVVKTKFVKKYWGYPVFSEDNDNKLVQVLMAPCRRAENVLDEILAHILKSGRDVVSVWLGIGGTLMHQARAQEASLKKVEERKVLGLKIAFRLVPYIVDKKQLLEFVLSHELLQCMFHTVTKRNDPLTMASDKLFEQVCARLKSHEISPLEVVEKIWTLEMASDSSQRVELINSHNFLHMINLMSQTEAENYTTILVSKVMETDKMEMNSGQSAKKVKLCEECLRQLQHITASQDLTSPIIQHTTMALFLRLAFFQVEKSTQTLQHCQTCINFKEDSSSRRVCEAFFYRTLDCLATLNSGQQKKDEQLSNYLDLLYEQAQYVQKLLKAKSLKPIKAWSSQLSTTWDKLMNFVTAIYQLTENETDKDHFKSAFLLLSLFLGFHMLTDEKMAFELIKDIYVCYGKASGAQQQEGDEDDEEPEWVEVVTEVLLSLLSLPSHLSRVVAVTVFRHLLNNMTPVAVALITQVMVPKNRGADDAGGVLVAADNHEEEVETSDEDVDEDTDEEKEAIVSEEEEEVDEDFRQSVRQALGNAADEQSDGEQELPDMSDAEMFRLDSILAEVFKQKLQKGSKKTRVENRKEMVNFRMRVLDLVEILIKSDRCGDFLLDLIKPLLLLITKTKTDSQGLAERSKAIFYQLKSTAKPGLQDNVHTANEQREIFQQLLQLAQSATETSHLKSVSIACDIVMNIHQGKRDDQVTLVLCECKNMIQEMLHKVITKQKSKPHLSFFVSLIELDPIRFQDLSALLLKNLQDEGIKTYGRIMCCSLLASLCKKTDNVCKSHHWMTEAVTVTKELILQMDRKSIKVMLYKDILGLALALQARSDIMSQPVFDEKVKKHLMEVKSGFNTDLRRLANKIIASVDRELSVTGPKSSGVKKRKKVQTSMTAATPDAKRRKC